MLAGLAAVAAAACDTAPDVPPEARVTYDTIDGVEHVISGSRGTWRAAERWTVDADAALTIGTMDGAEEYTFGGVAGVVVGPDGRVYVADTQAHEVRVFSPDGVFLFRFGRDGEGPGEFRNISGLTLAPEGIAALDGRLGRVTVFDLHGAVDRTFQIQRPYMIFERGAPMRFDRDGRFYDRAPLDAAPLRDSLAVFVYSPAGHPMDTLFVGVVEEDALVIERDGRPYMSFPRPFAPRPSLAIGPEGGGYFTRGAEYRVTVLSRRGETTRVLRRRVRPRPVTDAARDSAIAAVEARYRDAGAAPPRAIELPETKPAISRLVADAGGHLWILSQPDPSWSRLEWWVHDPHGRYLGVVVTPRMNVMQIGADFVAGVMTDEVGVDRVVVARLLKQPRG